MDDYDRLDQMIEDGEITEEEARQMLIDSECERLEESDEI